MIGSTPFIMMNRIAAYFFANRHVRKYLQLFV